MRRDYLEEEVDELTYPAQLSAPIRRMLAAKMRDIQQSFQSQTQGLHQQLNNLTGKKTVAINDLPRAARPLARQMTKLYEARKKVEETLKTQYGVEAGYAFDNFYVQAPAAEIERKRAETNAKIAELRTAHEKALADMKGMALKLADAEIANIKAKIAKTNPQLVAELDSIGQAALPEPPKPPKALKGKTEKAAANG